jgi:hypothetical protein
LPAVRRPGQIAPLGLLVAHEPDLERDLVSLTNVAPTTAAAAEHTYQFDREDGPNIEDVRVQTLERRRRLFALVLLAALLVSHLGAHGPAPSVVWLRRLGGKLGIPPDADGPDILLAGVSADFATAATLASTAHNPFPYEAFTYG